MESAEAYRAFLKGHWWKERDKLETDQAKHVPSPSSQKPYPEDAMLVDLVAPDHLKVGEMSVREVIKRRRSHRKFTQESLTLEELSFLLWATQGVRQLVDGGATTRRTVPSAGSRHPFETYLIVNRVNGLEPGLYRYLPLDHKMLFLCADARLADKVGPACRNQPFVGTGAIVFIWTVIPYRSEWRYVVVAPKMIALDAGHLCQNLYFASEAVGAGTCAVGAYDQDQMDAVVGVDGNDEFVIYAAPVGKVN